jgi:hypothetical protein
MNANIRVPIKLISSKSAMIPRKKEEVIFPNMFH